MSKALEIKTSVIIASMFPTHGAIHINSQPIIVFRTSLSLRMITSARMP